MPSVLGVVTCAQRPEIGHGIIATVTVDMVHVVGLIDVPAHDASVGVSEQYLMADPSPVPAIGSVRPSGLPVSLLTLVACKPVRTGPMHRDHWRAQYSK